MSFTNKTPGDYFICGETGDEFNKMTYCDGCEHQMEFKNGRGQKYVKCVASQLFIWK